MSQSTRVRLGVIGLGVMGSHHTADIAAMDNAELAAVCDIDRERADRQAALYDVLAFYDSEEMLNKVELDGIVIATPHYDHPTIGMAAFKKGIHVLTEKPIAVHTRDARRFIAAYETAREQYPDLVFSAMFQQRTNGYWQKIKSLIDEGELGQLVRTTWLITDWFRTQSYYDNGGWRATWKGEGGGVLLNQCPHNLDLYQWFVGMPQRVTGFATLGKYHNIEVEDEVTAYLEYDNGMVGHFITTTGESPGTNRLEIVGENGKVIFENDKLTFYRNRGSMLTQIKEAQGGFAKVENWVVDVPYQHHGTGGHRLVTENFADAILNGAELIAPAVEGLNGLMLGNAIMLSSFTGGPVDVPIDDDAYADKLAELAANSRFQKVVREQEVTDFEDSY